METSQLTEKEIDIIEEIHKNPKINQRTLAQNVGLSLGLTNLIIKKLVKTGYIKIKQLNKRKIQYLLTPKGFAEKTKKTYNYILKTTNYFFYIYEKLRQLITNAIKNGKVNFYILADEEIYNLFDLVFKTLNVRNIKYKKISKLPQKFENKNSLYLVTSTFYASKDETENVINLTEYLNK